MANHREETEKQRKGLSYKGCVCETLADPPDVPAVITTYFLMGPFVTRTNY